MNDTAFRSARRSARSSLLPAGLAVASALLVAVPAAAHATTAAAATAKTSAKPAAAAVGSHRTVAVRDAAGLEAALAAARPGDVIALADGTYRGTFSAAANGTSAAPITLRGSRQAVLTTGSVRKGGYALHVTGSHLRVEGLSVRTAKKGIVLDGSVGTVIDGVEVSDIGQEGIHFREGSASGVVRRSVVHDTGKRSPQYGEGIYVGSAVSNWGTYTHGAPDRSDHVVIEANTIYDTAAEGVDAKEGTTGGVIRGNTFRHAGFSGKNSADSWVDVKGNGWTVTGNKGSVALLDAFQTHVVAAGWGKNNSFTHNTITAGVPGYAVGVYPKPGTHGNRVSCDTVKRGGGKGLSNVACS